MSSVRVLTCVSLAALALAACSKPSATASGSAAAPATKDAMGPEIPADRMPVIKAGLWEVIQTTAGKPTRREQTCEDGKRRPMAMGRECQKLTLHRTLLGKYVIDGDCDMGGGIQLVMHVEAAGDFQSHWSGDFTSRVKLPGQGEQVDTNRKEARYLGACPTRQDAGG